MPYMLCRSKVADFEKWKQIFDSHSEAHRQSGLQLQQLLRNMDDPNDLFYWFEVTDMEKARGFVSSPDVPEAKRQSGVVGDTEIFFLS